MVNELPPIKQPAPASAAGNSSPIQKTGEYVLFYESWHPIQHGGKGSIRYEYHASEA